MDGVTHASADGITTLCNKAVAHTSGTFTADRADHTVDCMRCNAKVRATVGK